MEYFIDIIVAKYWSAEKIYTIAMFKIYLFFLILIVE